MKKTLSLMLVLAMLACSSAVLTSCSSSPQKSSTSPAPSSSAYSESAFANLEAVTWRFSTQSGSQTVVGKMANWIADEVATRTDGKFTIEVYTDAILYSDRECIEALGCRLHRSRSGLLRNAF